MCSVSSEVPTTIIPLYIRITYVYNLSPGARLADTVTPETPPTRTKALMMAAIRLLPPAAAFSQCAIHVTHAHTRLNTREKLDKSSLSDSSRITANNINVCICTSATYINCCSFHPEFCERAVYSVLISRHGRRGDTK